MNLIEKILEYSDMLGPLLGLLLIFFRRGKKTGGHFYIFSYLLLQLLTNSVAKYLMYQETSNIRVYQANAFFSFVLITLWFWQALKPLLSPRWYQWLQKGSAAGTLLFIPMLFSESTSALNSLSLSFTSFCICFYCVIFYLISLQNLDDQNLLRTPNFWTVTAFFFYFSTCFVIFISYKIFTQNKERYFVILWLIHNLILFISCCILAIAGKQAPK